MTFDLVKIKILETDYIDQNVIREIFHFWEDEIDAASLFGTHIDLFPDYRKKEPKPIAVY